MRGIRALRGAEYPVPDLVFPWPACCWDGGNRACELGAADPWERRLVLVFASDLKQVKEICPCRVDFN